MKEKSVTYIMREQAELAVLLSGLSEKYTVQEGGLLVYTVSYFDTFDWRLFDKGLICLRQGSSVYALTDFSDENRIEAEGPVRNKLFPLDFAKSVLGEKLQLVAGIRALLPLVEITR
ncbi:MAG: hypothetical protein PHZ02_04150, partial [Desulfocapsaceae bacterium]|nr:hypothetical protein [Desulfocapsaceae bacterium]